MLTSDAAVAAVAHGMGVEAAVLALGIVIHINTIVDNHNLREISKFFLNSSPELMGILKLGNVLVFIQLILFLIGL